MYGRVRGSLAFDPILKAHDSTTHETVAIIWAGLRESEDVVIFGPPALPRIVGTADVASHDCMPWNELADSITKAARSGLARNSPVPHEAIAELSLLGGTDWSWLHHADDSTRRAHPELSGDTFPSSESWGGNQQGSAEGS
eukprot:4621064-Pyramimonas_sp.AAC.1